MSKYAREVSQAIRDYFGKDAGGVRSVFVRKNSDADAAQIRKKQEKKQYLVKGRGVGGLVLWDVFELDGFSQPQLAGTDFQFQEEAIAFARDRSLGRMSVGYGKIRGMFKAGKGGVIVPGKGIDTPGQGHVNVVHTRQGIVVG
jgi:hypothetical protein|tara:strand:+ start:189 stop:617 length:429 start_codon:yes stop_codon:yes gene_type:complete